MRIILAGNHQKWQDQIEARCRKIGNCFESEQLCRVQRDQSAAGRREAHLCRSIYGWTLRYASGLQEWGIIYSSKNHNPQNCLTEALNWVATSPELRSVCVEPSEIDRCEKDGHDCSALREHISKMIVPCEGVTDAALSGMKS